VKQRISSNPFTLKAFQAEPLIPTTLLLLLLLL
jgi:hypothetical protein